MHQLMIFIVLAEFLLNRNKSKCCVLPDPRPGVVEELPGARLQVQGMNINYK